MAETALFTIASKLLQIASSQTFTKIKSVWNVREDLDQLRKTIGTIRASLLDAERQQESSDLVRDWLRRLRDVMYEADDLFDEISIDSQLKKQMKGNKLLTKVHSSICNFNSLASSKMIAKRVKVVRKKLDSICNDMTHFKFVQNYKCEDARVSIRAETGSFVDPKEVIGRDGDKEEIIEMLFEGSGEGENVSVIAITGIGGMGKTTLAQLVYNDEDVGKHFGKKWWACISDVFDEKEVVRKILKSIIGEIYHDLSMDWLQVRIREAITDKKYLLVLDDMWEEDHGRWLNLRSLLSMGAKGSCIVVTTRSSSVARATNGIKTHVLGGLTEEMSWRLFKRLAFSVEQEDDPASVRLGKEIVKKCANVPLAIKAIGSLLYSKNSIREWEYFRNNELFKIELGDNPIMSTLKLSYNHLPSSMKQCFAYCSLFPKDYLIEKEDLIYLWIAQGYIDPSCEKQPLENVGHLYFMELLRRSFFKEVTKNDDGEINSCKMHDLVHDLAQSVAVHECSTVTRQFHQGADCIHVSFDHGIDDPWTVLKNLDNCKRLRSIVTVHEGHICFSAFVELVTKFRFLRALRLSNMSIEKIPSTLGELKHLRYLNLSHNGRIKSLPHSIAKILNLVALDVSYCGELEFLPADFAKLIKLTYLNITSCNKLSYMPPGFGKMTCLQRLSDFIVGKGGDKVKCSNLFSLARLNLEGNLTIKFLYWDCSRDIEPDTKKCILQGHENLSKLRLEFEEGVKLAPSEADLVLEFLHPPPSLKVLEVLLYPGTKIPYWGMDCSPCLLPNLSHVEIGYCSECRYLPSFKQLPRLETLCLDGLDELEYIEEETSTRKSSTLTESFFPFLKTLVLRRLPKLMGWSRKITTDVARSQGSCINGEIDQLVAFPLVSSLTITDCPQIKSLPEFRLLQTLHLDTIDNELVQRLLLQSITSSNTLQNLAILNCHEMMGLPEGLTSLEHLQISYCPKLKCLCLPPQHLNVLEELCILKCGELKLWEEEKRGIDWDSMLKLRILKLDQVPGSESLPKCLERRSALGQLKIVQIL